MSFRTEQGHRPHGEKNPLVQHNYYLQERTAVSSLLDNITLYEVYKNVIQYIAKVTPELE